MKYVITETKMVQIILNFLDKEYGNFKIYENAQRVGLDFYGKNNNIYMIFESSQHDLYLYGSLYSDLENIFSLGIREIQKIIREWVKLRYNLDVVSVFNGGDARDMNYWLTN